MDQAHLLVGLDPVLGLGLLDVGLAAALDLDVDALSDGDPRRYIGGIGPFFGDDLEGLDGISVEQGPPPRRAQDDLGKGDLAIGSEPDRECRMPAVGLTLDLRRAVNDQKAGKSSHRQLHTIR